VAIALPWEYASGLAAAAGAIGAALALAAPPKARAVGAFLRETALLLALYGLWQLAGRLSAGGADHARDRAAWIERFEAGVHLPSEAATQQLVLGHPVLVQIANLYYAGVHFPVTIAFLVWLFIWRRGDYSRIRWVLVGTTLACLLIQLMPVAPPRLMPGFVDTGVAYGQSVYGTGFGADELSAMPSVHVAWAAFVAFYLWRLAGRGWRWLGPVHLVLTVLVVVVTGNHWWLDGIVAGVLLVASAWAVTGIRAAWRRRRTPDGVPVPVRTGPTDEPVDPRPDVALPNEVGG